MSMKKILIVDDDADMQSVLFDLLASEGYETHAALSGKIVQKVFSTYLPDLILLDIKLPDMDGMTLLKKIKEIDRNIIIIMITGHWDIKDAVTAIKLGAFDYVTKPFDNEEIMAAVKNALQTKHVDNNSQPVDISLREKEILHWLKKGKSSWEISQILHIGASTVNFHVKNILQKLNAVSRTHAVALAIERGLINLE